MIQRHAIRARSAQWHALRAQDLTASDLGAAVGCDPYKSPLRLYAEKAGLLLSQPDSPIMRRGRWMEAAVVAALMEENPGWEIRYPLDLYLRDDEARLGCTPDAFAITDEPGITNVQMKVVSRPVWERDWAGGPPLPYLLQTLAEGMLAEAQRSLLVALVVDTYSAELAYHPVPRHPQAERKLVMLAEQFWENVRTGNRPAANFELDTETVEALFPQSVPEPVLDLSGDNLLPGLLAQRAALKADIAAAEKQVKEYDTEIKDKLGAAETATLPGWKITWKTQSRKEVVIPAASFRVLRIANREEAA
jgi:predicted phage-related endonuclease